MRCWYLVIRRGHGFRRVFSGLILVSRIDYVRIFTWNRFSDSSKMGESLRSQEITLASYLCVLREVYWVWRAVILSLYFCTRT